MYKLNNIKFKNIEDLKNVKYILRDTESSFKRYIKKYKLIRYPMKEYLTIILKRHILIYNESDKYVQNILNRIVNIELIEGILKILSNRLRKRERVWQNRYK